jgi:5'-methylthioadenosine phosphorylase
MMSQFADLVGMTMASEAVVAQELGISYASLCSVDNYANGLGERELTVDEILQHARRNADVVLKIVTRYMERRK